MQAAFVLDVPYVAQNPELARGCEVTALTMLLRYAGVSSADKMTLAEQIDKVPYMEDGFHGNPYEAFVGDMYTFENPGYGVYHGPVARLAEQYMPNQIVDLTGANFDTLLMAHVARGRPVWVISNALWRKLADSEFETWHTRSGDVRITWEEHSVVITGFDSTSVYINDPLDPSKGKNKRLNRKNFREAWEQMGRQAITYRLGK
ncbi:C39 family peptidase [Pendulispora rubella]|uniref:C39 family peptidase n=1 Tax=Pendulispora rubella TaxID=2741070 RepID=A0ABZ2KWN6_9BACT